MSTNIVNQVAFLKTSREFPPETKQLSVEVTRSYMEIAAAVNNRTISIFPTNRPAVNGESWYLVNNQRQQASRQVYTFTSTAPINHGVHVFTPAQFVRCFGTYTDGTDSFGLVYGTSAATPGLITFYVTSTQIVFTLGAGAPGLTSGVIVLEWLSQA